MLEMALAETLAVAVPLRIDELLGLPSDHRETVAKRWAERGAGGVAHHGDMLMFRSKAGRRHTPECVKEQRSHCDCRVGTAEVFNALAKGLAALALSPGGVTWSGLHWCVEHPGGVRIQARQLDVGGLTDSYPDLGCTGSGYGAGTEDPDPRATVTIQPLAEVL